MIRSELKNREGTEGLSFKEQFTGFWKKICQCWQQLRHKTLGFSRPVKEGKLKLLFRK